MATDDASRAFADFVAVVKALRTPGTGCPWDLAQNHRTLRPYLIEETYELLEAIDRADDRALQEELGDVLLQVVLHAQLAADREAFSIKDVVEGIHHKMVRRHPHVFGDTRVEGTGDVLRNWDRIKEAETRDRGGDRSAAPLAGVPGALPALLRAQRLGSRAARAQLDDAAEAYTLSRVLQMLADLQHEVGQGLDQAPAPLADDRRVRRENALGEVLFALCQLARRLGVNAEDSLRACNARFVERIQARAARTAERQPDPQGDL
jgi:MazG family protein